MQKTWIMRDEVELITLNSEKKGKILIQKQHIFFPSKDKKQKNHKCQWASSVNITCVLS